MSETSILKLVRFKYLVESGIVKDRMALARAIENEGFPKPIALGTNTIAWIDQEIKEWVASRPRRTPKTGAKPKKSEIHECGRVFER